MKNRVFFFILFFIIAAASAVAEPAVFPEDAADWLSVLNSDFEETAGAIGQGYIEIDPEEYSSRADKIIYYPEGLSLWSSGGKIIQLRLDSAWGGFISGIRIGITDADLRLVMGEPWIEELGSLYYNLPWNEGPVRLRFVFTETGLIEIYLYGVR